MTRARNTQISITETPYYHCVSRCVRRAFLCGTDTHCGKSYSHRKKWIIKRLEKISQVYSIEVSAYAIMDNHLLCEAPHNDLAFMPHSEA